MSGQNRVPSTGSSAAAFTAPGLATFVDCEGGDRERDRWVGPPESEGGVDHEAREDSCGEVGAEHVLGALSAGGRGAELQADALLGAAERGHEDAGGREADAEPAGGGVSAGDQGAKRVLGDVGGEQEEADCDELLRALLGLGGEVPAAREAPDHDDRCKGFDSGIQAEAQQRDGARERRGGDRDRALERHVGEAQPGEQLGPVDQPVALVIGRRCRGARWRRAGQLRRQLNRRGAHRAASARWRWTSRSCSPAPGLTAEAQAPAPAGAGLNVDPCPVVEHVAGIVTRISATERTPPA